MRQKKYPGCDLARSRTVSDRPNARPLPRLVAAVQPPQNAPDNPITVFDLADNYSVHPEDDAKLTPQCPDVIIDAIRRRMEAVRLGASARMEEGNEPDQLAGESAGPGERGQTLPEVSAASEETELRLGILDDENKMLRKCLIESISQKAGHMPSASGSKESPVIELLNELTYSQRQRYFLEHRVKHLERIVRQDGDIFQDLIATEPVPDGKPECQPIIRHIRSDLEEHRALSETLGPALTIRGVLTIKMLQHQRAEPRSPSPAPSELDTVLSMALAADLAKQLDNSRQLLTTRSVSCVRNCSMCQSAKFLRMPPISTSSGQLQPLIVRPPVSSSTHMSEFNCSPSGRTACCHQPICDECYYPAIVSSIATDWWRNLGSHRWLPCPFPRCSSLLSVSHDTELSTILRTCRDPAVLAHVRRFECASRLRAAVAALRPDPDALYLAASLHAHLQKHNFILEPVDYDDGTAAATNLPLVELLPVSIPTATDTDTDNTTSDPTTPNPQLQVPIFTSLLLRPGGDPASFSSPSSPPSSSNPGRKCDTCHTLIPDITTGSPDSEARWAKVAGAFPGDWAWMVRAFPPPGVLRACSEAHGLGTCRACLERYVAGEMRRREGGAVGCRCRVCGHVYGREEVRVLMGADVFAGVGGFG